MLYHRTSSESQAEFIDQTGLYEAMLAGSAAMGECHPGKERLSPVETLLAVVARGALGRRHPSAGYTGSSWGQLETLTVGTRGRHQPTVRVMVHVGAWYCR